MSTAGAIVFAVAALLVILTAVRIIRANAEHTSTIKETLKNSWGAKSSQLFSAESVKRIRTWSDEREQTGEQFCGGHAIIDDITANDLELDRVFGSVDHTLSTPGREVHYEWLRHPLLSGESLKERSDLIERFGADGTFRDTVGGILAEIGHRRSDSFCADIRLLREAERIGSGKYLLLTLSTAAGFLLLLIQPLLALAVLIPSLFLDFRTHLIMKQKTLPYLRGFRSLLVLLKAAKKLKEVTGELPGLSDEDADAALRTFSGFRRGAFLVTSAGTEGTGIGDALLEYVKLFFHIDLLQFDRMLDAFNGCEREAFSLLEAVGTFDAALSAASWKAASEVLCTPSFENAGAGTYRVDGLVHTLLEHPVENSAEIDGGLLLTGSNASGKSTFLKAAALAAILAQSMNAVPAKAYRAPFVRVITSMALTDNLRGGESYYLVEIRSLKRILDQAERSEQPVLAVIDEVLRGTNTVERIAASSQLLKRMREKGILVFAATHDSELTGLLEGRYCLAHFSEQISDGDVVFDYKLRKGRATGRNAIRLLADAGYEEDAVEAAFASAAGFEKTGEWRL